MTSSTNSFQERLRQQLVRGESLAVEDWRQHITAIHDRLPSDFSRIFTCYSWEGKTSYEILIERSSADRCRSVVDLACGDGSLFRYARSRLPDDYQWLGVDLSQGEIERARRRFSEASARFEVAPAVSLSSESETMDAVLCHMAFMLMPDHKDVTDEVRRVLRPGGVFATVVPRGSDQTNLYQELQREIQSAMEKEWPEIARSTALGPPMGNQEKVTKYFTDHGFATVDPVLDFQVAGYQPLASLVEFFETMYLVQLLPQEAFARLTDRLRSVARRHADVSGGGEVQIPLRLVIARK